MSEPRGDEQVKQEAVRLAFLLEEKLVPVATQVLTDPAASDAQQRAAMEVFRLTWRAGNQALRAVRQR